MPGRHESLDVFESELRARRVAHVVCLAPLTEIEERSPSYAALLRAVPPWRTTHLPIPDFGAPADIGPFHALAAELAAELASGGQVVIHCAAGIGRSGTLAARTLVALGLERDKALAKVADAGAGPETPAQLALV